MTYNVFGGTLNLAQSKAMTTILLAANTHREVYYL